MMKRYRRGIVGMALDEHGEWVKVADVEEVSRLVIAFLERELGAVRMQELLQISGSPDSV